ncbi:protein kinase [Gemmatimonadota bacterium]
MIGRTISHYKIVDKLGEGGMGAVYKAEDTTLNRLVAIKALSSHLSENDEARERFIREAQAASSLNHTNITTVHELLEDEGEQFIVMEYVDGKTIRDVVESSRVSIRKAVDILIQAAEALEAAHNKGILHRDVKSANIMVSMEGNVKVMDFGLAHLEDRSQLTRTGTTMGTLAYSSPEQLVGSTVDKRSEIFSLGVVFYELLTGQLPFKSPSEGELVFEIINTEQERLTTCREDTPESVCSVVNRMLIKKPELRYQTCGELLDNLKAIRNELETTTVQISTDLINAKARKRNLIVLSSAAIALLCVITIFVADRSSSNPRIAVLWPYDVGTPSDESFTNLFITKVWDDLARQQHVTEVLSLAYTYQSRSRALSQPAELSSVEADYSLVPSIIWPSDGDQNTTITVQFELDDRRGVAVWRERYPVESTESISIINSISRDAVAGIIGRLSPKDELIITEHTDNQDAQAYFLQGLSNRSKNVDIRTRRRTIEMFQNCVQEDPQFGRGWAHLSQSASIAAFIHGNQEFYTIAEDALAKAQELSSDLPDTKLAQATYHSRCLLDFAEASQWYEEVLEIEPGNSGAHSGLAGVLRRCDDFTGALHHYIRAYQLAPNRTSLLMSIGVAALYARDYELAETYLARRVSLNPQGSESYKYLALLYLLWQGDMNKSREVFERMPESEQQEFRVNTLPSAERALIRIHAGFMTEWYQGLTNDAPLIQADVAIVSGDSKAALELYQAAHASYQDSVTASSFQSRTSDWKSVYLYFFGLACAGIGDEQRAIEYGRQAVEVYSLKDDSFEGSNSETALAEILTQTGYYSEAIDILERLLKVPSLISTHLLRLDPRWEPLRDHQRFESLLANYN